MTLYCDGGHNKNTGDEAWASVVDEDYDDMVGQYKYLFDDMNIKNVKLPKSERLIAISKFNDVKKQQNNGAELLAFVMALRISNSSDKYKIIYSDSDLLVKYWSVKGINSITQKTMDKNKLKYVEEAIILRKKFENKGGNIVKILGKNNKADLGYHK